MAANDCLKDNIIGFFGDIGWSFHNVSFKRYDDVIRINATTTFLNIAPNSNKKLEKRRKMSLALSFCQLILSTGF